MNAGCHKCRYELKGELSPHHRCLLFYGQAIAKEALKSGLIGECHDFKGMLEYAGEVKP